MLPARFVPEGGTFHKRERGRKSVRILTSVWSLGGRNRTDEFFSFDGFGKTMCLVLQETTSQIHRP